MIAIEDLDVVARQPRGQGRAQGLQHGRNLLGGVVDQGLGDGQFDVLQFAINGVIADGQAAAETLHGGMDRGVQTKDDLTHQLREAGEEQAVRILPLGSPLEELIEAPGVKEAFQDGPGHDTDGALLQERLKDRFEDHQKQGSTKDGGSLLLFYLTSTRPRKPWRLGLSYLPPVASQGSSQEAPKTG